MHSALLYRTIFLQNALLRGSSGVAETSAVLGDLADAESQPQKYYRPGNTLRTSGLAELPVLALSYEVQGIAAAACVDHVTNIYIDPNRS